MTEVELLGYVLEVGEVSSSQLAKRFRVSIGHAYQVLRRLEEKGLLERQHRQYRSKFRLTERAKQLSGRAKQGDSSLAGLALLGLAFAILLLASIGNDSREEKKKEKEKDERRFLF